MALKRYKTGARHRFFCVRMLWAAVVLFTLPVITAQIQLPDQTEIAPADDAGAQPADAVDENEVQRMIQQMQNNQGRELQETRPTAPVPGQKYLEAAEKRYASAVESVRVFGLLLTGETFQGVLKNRSFVVENEMGRFPLRLGELRQWCRTEGQEVFIFELQDGDRVDGRPRLDGLVLEMPEGGTRVLLMRNIQKIDFLSVP